MFLEWCEQPNQRNGTFLPASEVLVKTGFRSVYAFETQPTESKGLNRFPVVSATLFLDFDDGVDGAVLPSIDKLNQQKIAYKLFTSGSKGCHLHIDIEPMSGIDVPYSQRQYVIDAGFNSDLSLYRHSSLIRLPGTIHLKTGKPKELIKESVGDRLSVPMLKTPEPKFSKVQAKQDDMLYAALTRSAGLVHKSPMTGERTKTMWSLSRNFHDSGISFDTALELAYSINATWSHPLDEAGVLRAVKQGYSL